MKTTQKTRVVSAIIFIVAGLVLSIFVTLTPSAAQAGTLSISSLQGGIDNAALENISANDVNQISGEVMALQAILPADKRDDEVKRKKQAELEEARLRSSLEGINSDLSETVLRLQRVQNDLGEARTELKEAEAQLQAFERKQSQLQDELNDVRAALKTVSSDLEKQTADQKDMKQRIGAIVRQRYREGTATTSLTLMMSSQTTGDLTDKVQTAATAVRLHNGDLERLEVELADTRNKEARQKALNERVTELEAEAQQQVIEAGQIRKAKEGKVEQYRTFKLEEESAKSALEAKKYTAEKDVRKAQVKQEEAAKEIARIDEENRRKAEAARRKAEAARKKEEEQRRAAEAAAKKKAGSNSNKAKAPAPVAKPQTSASTGHFFGRPISGPLYVTSPWGQRRHPILGIQIMHYGVDISSPVGQQQLATAPGTVYSTRWEGSGGNTVKINHGYVNGHSWVTVHRHLSRFLVSPGQKVSRGQVIGLTGATGNVTGPHVHYEVWRDGVTINPMSLPGF